MHQALYRSFRPETFDGIWGQEHIIKILKNQVASETTGHAYLFCGTRGTGKTSMARILAKGVNCITETDHRPCGVCSHCMGIRDGVFLDVMEIDAASNNGVENIRELRESVKYPPVSGRQKVYIIDEVHMLSTGAFNALLKTLEEPPDHVMFILATTEPQKLPATILSRCMRLDFRRISERLLREGMRRICKERGIKISESALGLIAANADGSVRDALSLLDQCIGSGEVEIARQDVLDLLGTVGEEIFLELTDHVSRGNVAEALLLLDRILADGKEVRQLIKDWMGHYRGLMLTKFVDDPSNLLNTTLENVQRIDQQSQTMQMDVIDRGIKELAATLAEARWSTQPRILLELCVIHLAGQETSASPGEKKPPVKKSPPKQRQPKPVAEPDAVEKKDAAASGDPENLWQQIFENTQETASFLILRKGGHLVRRGVGSYFLEVSNEIMLRCATDHLGVIKSRIQTLTGETADVQCCVAEHWVEQEASLREKATSIGNRLDTTVEIV